MTTTSELKVHETGSAAAHKCMAKNNVLYDSSGQPMASVYFVFPNLLKFTHPVIRKKKIKRSVMKKMKAIATLIAPVLKDNHPVDDDALLEILKPYKKLLLELDDEEICALLNEAIDQTEEFIGHDCAFFIFHTLQRIDDKFGEEIFGPHYTYNDSDSYCGQHDIQFCYPGKGDSIYGCDSFDVVFLQIHPGGDARNMASGYFYVPEGIDEMTNLFDTLGASHAGELGTTVEIPVEFPLEQWIQKVDDEAWDSIYREEVKGDDGHYNPKETLYFHDFKDGLCRTYLSPKGDNGAGVDVYRCYDVACWKGRDFWTWTPEGEIVGQMRSMAGISATPWKPEEFKYSTKGYFKWVGPMPGTDEWTALMAELGLEPVAPRKEKEATPDMFSAEEEE